MLRRRRFRGRWASRQGGDVAAMGHSHLSAAVTHSWQASPGAAPGVARRSLEWRRIGHQLLRSGVLCTCPPEPGLSWAAVFAALAVGLGAFGAHGLKERLDLAGRTDVYETAVRYHMYHGARRWCAWACVPRSFPRRGSMRPAAASRWESRSSPGCCTPTPWAGHGSWAESCPSAGRPLS